MLIGGLQVLQRIVLADWSEQLPLTRYTRDDDQIHRAVADDLVGDVPLRALRVARFWLLDHGLYLPRSGQKTLDGVVLLP